MQQQQLIDRYGLLDSVKFQNKCDALIEQMMLHAFKQCSLINAEFANAFSLVHGNVVLTKGLLKNIRNDDQLAHILAHEHAHLEMKHHQQAQQLLNNPPKFFTKSRVKKFYRNIEKEADFYADDILLKLKRDHLQIHHYLKRIQKTYEETSEDHIKLSKRIKQTSLSPEKLEKFWLDKGAF